jgi:hypothetical protein
MCSLSAGAGYRLALHTPKMQATGYTKRTANKVVRSDGIFSYIKEGSIWDLHECHEDASFNIFIIEMLLN